MKTIAYGAIALCLMGCRIDRQLHKPGQLSEVQRAESPYLKAHFKNGDVAVLSDWTFFPDKNIVEGRGELRDMHRRVRSSGTYRIPAGDVALFESNREVKNGGIFTAMTVVTITSAMVSVLCLSNPKACFGSCPTFYFSDGNTDYLAAEGFSESVAPALEAVDVDALYRARIEGRVARARVTNEALETHAIRQANLLVARKPPGGRVVATTDGAYRDAVGMVAPTACRAPEGDCLNAIATIDEHERISVSDGVDLATRETVELTFDDRGLPAGQRGIRLEVRQGFITTYLFYQALAYMGRQAGSYLASIEQGDEGVRDKARALYRLLGGIDVQVEGPDGRFSTVGTYLETGPLARENQVVPLPKGSVTRRIRLVMARGHFRLGNVALVALGGESPIMRIAPARLHTHAGDARMAQAWLSGQTPFLSTLPGDEHRLEWDLPDEGAHLEFFLESKGYYLEWMRQAWLAEESAWKLATLFTRPATALRELAPAYKRIEPDIERLFWESRYVR